MLRVMIVDDEPPARRGLTRLLQAHHDTEVVGQAGTLAEAEGLARALRPDAIFLDVEMSSELSFRLLDRLDPVPAIIFVTAHGSYAPAAFDVAALDFVLKPVDPQRLAVAVERLRRHRREDAPGRDPMPSPPARLQIRLSNEIIRVPIDDIALCIAEADFTRIVMCDAREYLTCRLLGQVSEELPAPPFLRISRSVTLNTERIASVRFQSGGRSAVSFGSAIAPVELGRVSSRRLRHHIQDARPLPLMS